MKPNFSLLALLLACAVPVLALDDAPFQELKTYDFQNRKTVETINGLIRSADAATQGEIETKLLSVAQDPITTFAAQQEIGKMLWKVGSGRAVPVLSKWLSDEKLGDVARYALERNADPLAGKALRDALATVKGKALVGIITSVGERRDSAALPALKNLASDKDVAISSAAIIALGKIGTTEAVTLLKAIPNKSLTVYQALLVSASQMASQKLPVAKTLYRQILDTKTAPEPAREGAARGLLDNDIINASSLVLELLRAENTGLREVAAHFVRTSQVPTRQLIAEAEKLPAPGQSLLLSALADRKQTEVLPLLMRAAASPDAEVRLAALRAFAPMEGNAEATLMLAKTIARGTTNAEKEAARNSLSQLRGKAVNTALVTAIPNAEMEIRRAMVNALGLRYAVSAKPQLFAWAADANLNVSDVAANALGEIVLPEDYPAIVKLLASAPGQTRDTAEILTLRVARNIPEADRAMPLLAAINDATPETRISLIKVLAGLGGNAALNAVRAELKNPDPTIHEATIRALTSTPDTGAMPDLLQLAQNAPTKGLQILSFRSYLRLAENAAKQNGAKPADIYLPAIKIATETPEKRSIIAGLSKINSPETLALIVPFLDDENTRNEAAGAVIYMVRDFKGKNPTESRAALEKIATTVKDDNLLKQSNELLRALPAN